MNWDEEYYKEIYDFMIKTLSQSNYAWLTGKKPCIIKHVTSFLPMITDCVHNEDYEGAKATRDAIIYFLRERGADIADDIKFILPEYKPMKINGIICYGKEDGTSGGAELIS